MENLDQVKVKKMLSYRWLVWGLLAVAYIIVFFHRLAVGAVKDDLMEAFSLDSAGFANLGSMYFYAYMFMQIPVGFLVDSLGARKTVTIGTLLAAIGSIMFGLAPTVFLVFLGRFIVGVGVSVVFISILKIQSQWFKESEFGTMSGITSFVGNIGGIIAQTPLVWLVAAITWRMSFVAIGVVSFIMAILIYVFVRNTPEELGFPSIAEIEGKRVSDSVKKEKINLVKALVEVCTNWRTWPGFITFAGFFGGFICISGTFGIQYMKVAYGIEKAAAANYMILLVLGLAVGSLLIGKISDRLKKRKLPMLISGSILVGAWSILIFVNGGKPPIEIMYLLFFILGLSTSTFVLGWACAKELNNPEVAGISTSVVNMGGFFGAAIIPPMVGKALGMNPTIADFNGAFKIAYIFVIIAFLALFLVKETNCKNIYKRNK